MDTTNLISVQHLSRFYGDFCAVDDLSFEVARGQIVGFLGTNGAGKTTTMQMLTGNLAPSHGQISIAGYDLLDQPLLAKKNLGYLPEQPPLYPELRVDEYLRFCARLHGLSRSEANHALDYVLNACSLADVRRRLIANLSKGYQQRVGIAQAIIHNPAVVILDEPTVGLDPIQIREIRDLIRALGKHHSVILSTHLLPEVQALCSHVQILHLGQLVLQSPVADLLAQPTTSLRIGLRHPPKLDRLQALAQVEQVEMLDSQHARLHVAEGVDIAEQLVETAVAERWGLFELIPEHVSLEQLFINLTCQDEAHAARLHPDATEEAA